MKSKTIDKVVKRAKEYVKEGYKIGQAISMAQREVRKQEIEAYEK